MSDASPAAGPAVPSLSVLRRFELAESALLAGSTLATAWCGYQSSRWSGVMSINFSESQARRSSAIVFEQRARSQTEVDLAIFTEWLRAVLDDRPELATLIRRQFSPELESAVATWLAEGGEQGEGTPFSAVRYQPLGSGIVEAVQMESEADFEEALDANQNSDNYVLLTVVFALVLLLVALGSRFAWQRVRLALLICAGAFFSGAAAVVATYPVH